jgi:hypothetical protein
VGGAKNIYKIFFVLEKIIFLPLHPLSGSRLKREGKKVSDKRVGYG